IQHACLENVRRRRESGQCVICRAWLILATAEEFVQHVTLIGGQHQCVDGQTHLTGQLSGKYIAKVAGWHSEGDAEALTLLCWDAVRDAQPCPEVVNTLGNQTAEVDRVNGTKRVSGLELEIAIEFFDEILRIVKNA